MMINYNQPGELTYGVLYLYGIGEEMISILHDIFGADVKITMVGSPEHEEPKLVARRFNVGNLGHKETIEVKLTRDIEYDEHVIRIFKSIWLSFADFERGSLEIETRERRVSLKMKELPPDVELDYDDLCFYDEDSVVILCSRAPHSRDEELLLDENEKKIHAQEIIEESAIHDEEAQLNNALHRIEAAVLDYVLKFKEDPREYINTLLQGKIIVRNDRLSRLTVNGDLDIFLPDFNEMQLNLHPLSKTVYLLFLLHPEGIELRKLSKKSFIRELEQIYTLVMPNRDEELMRASIDRLLDRDNGTLNQHLSRIKRLVKSKILDNDLASQYYISGKRNEPYRIPIAADHPELLSLPRALTDEI